MKVFLKTYGCQMNFRDSEFVTGILINEGFKVVDSIDGADVILFNSCSVRKHAEDRLFSNIASLKDLKQKKPSLAIGLIGCTAQNYKEKILRRVPIVDMVCGPGNEPDISKLLKDVIKNRCPIVATDKVDAKREETFPKYRRGNFKAYVSIGEGCNNFCSYCIVPYVRGKERSREMKDIVREVENLGSRGFKEITLLGQNVNSYGRNTKYERRPKGVPSEVEGRTTNFVKLLALLNSVRGIERIRFMTSHPKDASLDLFKAMRDLDKVCEHLHLPLQSGSSRILKLMNRGYSNKHYLKLSESYKKILPEGALTTDIIVGFPSESKKDFQDTLKIMKDVRFDSAFTFKYSPRPPAESAKLKDDVLDKVKEERLAALLDLQCKISLKRNEPMKNKTVEVLVDGNNKKNPSLLTGRTRTNKITVFEGDKVLIGEFVNVKIGFVTPYALKGRIVKC